MQFRFWDMEAALKLIRDQYSWFLPTFEGYSTVVAKGKPPDDILYAETMTSLSAKRRGPKNIGCL